MGGVYSVGQITKYLKGLIGKDPLLRAVTVSGELSNVKYHSSGHIYFTIKDNEAALSGVMFAGDAYTLKFRLENGAKVEITGSIDIYNKAGTYQIYAKQVKRAGLGELYERFIKLKQELEDMGMFAAEYKRDIPRYIKKLGVVTAPTGAAVRDIINVSKRRFPYVEILLYPAKVQGEGAAESISKGIAVLDQAGVDVIIAGRGGGSIEDLWAFNERIVAEAIFNCSTPVISAVGHETDTTIADYVADLRAPTPSAAAELAVFDYKDMQAELFGYGNDMKKALGARIDQNRLRLGRYGERLRKKRPDAVIADKRMRLADIDNNLRKRMQDKIRDRRMHTERIAISLPNIMNNRLDKAKHKAALCAEKLKGVSPLEKLTMGYSYVSDINGRNVRDAKELSKGDTINVYMLHGKVVADVTNVENKEY
ncbi:MAG: exodeoxyribonuclease VII large subunit [Lachnospiraceae bacterium]|nr:exodeoxyribonuclease VII large subunit [Lachnospiraceae bacterium]